MIRYILIHIQDYYDNDKQDITSEKLKQFKTKMLYFFDKQININSEYIQIRTLWNVSVAELRSESIVESICSILKKIYTPDRSRLKYVTLEILLQLRLALPLTKKQRDIVIQKVIQRYHQLHPSMITHKITKTQKQRRREQGLELAPTINKWENMMNNVFTVPFE